MRAWIGGVVVLLLSLSAAASLAWAVAPGTATFAGIDSAWLALAVAFAVNLGAWVPASLLKSERFYDLTGSVTFVSVTALALAAAQANGTLDATGLVTAAMVLAWTLRLGSFLVLRIRRAGKDGRFDALKQSAGRFLVPWALQALWVFVTALAAFAVVASSRPREGLSGFTVAGWLVWVAGFALEVVADGQKARFQADPANAGRFITTGTWAWVRHPNYLGEITLWAGLALAALPLVEGPGYAVLASPLLVFVLLRFVSGIPLLEQRGEARWGALPAYRAYLANTPRLLPRLVPRLRPRDA